MNPVTALIVFFIGSGILGAGLMMLVKGTYPGTRTKANPIFSTFLLLFGHAMVLHFGDPGLLNALINYFAG